MPDHDRADDVRARVVAVAVARASAGRGGAPGRSVARSMSVTGSSGSYSTRDLLGGAARLLGVLGGDERDRLAEVAHAVDREHRLVAELEPVALLARDVLVGEHGVDAGHRQRLGDVDREDARVRVRAADGVAPEHPRRDEVARVRELALDLRHAVGARHVADRRPTSRRAVSHGVRGQRSRAERRLVHRSRPHPGWGVDHPPPTVIVAGRAAPRKVSFAPTS